MIKRIMDKLGKVEPRNVELGKVELKGNRRLP